MEFIDLGLSVKWAKCNIGAGNPEEYGYDFPNNEGISFTNTEIIRLPTKEEAEELCKECTWELQTHAKGKYEWKVTGKNGNYILLPASYKEHGVEWRVGNYWLTGKLEKKPGYPEIYNHFLTFGKYDYGVNTNMDDKCNIRPVKVIIK